MFYVHYTRNDPIYAARTVPCSFFLPLKILPDNERSNTDWWHNVHNRKLSMQSGYIPNLDLYVDEAQKYEVKYSEMYNVKYAEMYSL